MVIKMITNIRGFRLYGASMVAAWAACGIAFCLSLINHWSRSFVNFAGTYENMGREVTMINIFMQVIGVLGCLCDVAVWHHGIHRVGDHETLFILENQFQIFAKIVPILRKQGREVMMIKVIMNIIGS